MKKPLLAITALHVQRKNFELSINNFFISHGESVGIIGPNGAGKTTLLLALAGLIKPRHAEIIFDENHITDYTNFQNLRAQVTMVFQEPLLLNATVRENIAMGLRMRGLPEKMRLSYVDEIAETLRISNLLSRRSHELSAGEAKRVSLARALVLKPKLLLMDEPFSSLDIPSRSAIIEDFERSILNTGCSVLFVSHDRDETLRLADRILILKSGRILQQGTAEEIMFNPADEFTASFIGVETLLNASVKETFESGFMAEVAGKTIEVAGKALCGETVTLGIRPENVVLSKEISLTSSMRNYFEGTIIGIAHAGMYVRVTVDCGFALIAYITPHSLQELGFREGSAVSASFKATAIQVIRHVQEKSR